jgi:hypothetical protein
VSSTNATLSEFKDYIRNIQLDPVGRKVFMIHADLANLDEGAIDKFCAVVKDEICSNY